MSSEIVSLGFDLDNTLYKQDEEINRKIQDYICRRVSGELGRPFEETREIFDRHYAESRSASTSLLKMGLESDHGKKIIQESLEKADIASILSEDSCLVLMLNQFSRLYSLFMITTSTQNDALKKLSALGIDPDLFSPSLYAGSPYLREDGSAFRYVAGIHGVSFSKMMFVGDREKTDILPAKKLGIKTAIVNSESEESDYQLTNIYELETILGEN